MRQIRHGVFETNSSSSHSISIRKNGGYYTQQEIEDSFYQCSWDDWDGKLSFWDSDLEFGRAPFEPLTTFKDKIRFAIASVGSDDTLRTEIESVMFEFIPGLKKIEYPTRNNWETDQEETYYGDIDHQSWGLLEGFMKRHNVTLREFLLSKKYVVFIDGDEYCVKEKLFESGLINKDDFEEVDA